MHNLDWRKKFVKAWRELNLVELRTLALSLAREMTDEAVALNGFILHLEGDLEGAARLYSQVRVSEILQPLFRELFEIDSRYLDMKLRRSSVQPGFVVELFRFLRLSRYPLGCFPAQLRHYSLYTWYIRSFWYSQRQSLISGILLYLYGRLTGNSEARVHGRYLFGHLMNIMGYPSIGVPNVMGAFKLRRKISPWMQVNFYSYMPYGLYMVSREEASAPAIIELADQALLVRPDPFYRILLAVCKLRGAAQVGDVETAESVAPFLIEISQKTGSKRFLYSSKADLALCYGVRGLLGRCEQLLSELTDFNPNTSDPVESGSVLRLRGWANFFIGNYEQSYKDAEGSLLYFGRSKSFYMAIEMAKVLKLVAGFRMRISQLHDPDELSRHLSEHHRELRRMVKKYRRNSTLLKMVEEERGTVLGVYQKFSQPGYSRTSNIFVCIQLLQADLQKFITAPSDNSAWQGAAAVIESSLNCVMLRVQSETGEPSFDVRRSFLSEHEVQISVPRYTEDPNNSGFDVVYFKCENIYQIPVVIDGLFSLRSTLIAQWKARDLQAVVLRSVRDATTSEMARQLAHDIRSPLSALNMVVSTFDGEADTRQLLIRNVATRINDIANSLLLGTKQLESRQSVDAEPQWGVARRVPLLPLVQEIVNEKKLLGGKSVISIQDGGRSSFGDLVMIEPAQMKRILSNLLNNSIEANEGSVGEISVSLGYNSGNVTLSICDDGVGISKEMISKIGQKAVTYGKAHGSGLGLYHAKTWIHQWGGELTIDSEVGQWTAVTIVLPFASEITHLGFTEN